MRDRNQTSAGNAAPIATRDHEKPGNPRDGERAFDDGIGMTTRLVFERGGAEKSSGHHVSGELDVAGTTRWPKGKDSLVYRSGDALRHRRAAPVEDGPVSSLGDRKGEAMPLVDAEAVAARAMV